MLVQYWYEQKKKQKNYRSCRICAMQPISEQLIISWVTAVTSQRYPRDNGNQGGKTSRSTREFGPIGSRESQHLNYVSLTVIPINYWRKTLFYEDAWRRRNPVEVRGLKVGRKTPTEPKIAGRQRKVRRPLIGRGRPETPNHNFLNFFLLAQTFTKPC